jgi:hypothetical protein
MKSRSAIESGASFDMVEGRGLAPMWANARLSFLDHGHSAGRAGRILDTGLLLIRTMRQLSREVGGR